MEKRFLNASDIAEILDISKGHAYKLMRQLNTELEEKGYLVIAGKVPAKYFQERCYFF